MSLSSNDGDVIEYLVAHGAYVEAARVCVERGDLARAVRLYERVWRFADALPLAERLGDPALAVRLALDAKLPARAVEEAAGQLREAALLYDRLVAQGADDEAPAARLAFGRLLAHLGRSEEAARLLQAAARNPGLRTSALRALCAPLLALGFRGAAVEVL